MPTTSKLTKYSKSYFQRRLVSGNLFLSMLTSMCVKSLRLVNPPTTQARFKNALKNSLANLVTNLKLKIVKLHFKLLNIEKIRISNYSDCDTIQYSDNRHRDLDILNPNRVGGLNQPTLFLNVHFSKIT